MFHKSIFLVFCIKYIQSQCLVPLVIKDDDSSFKLNGKISSPIKADIKQKNSGETITLNGVIYLELFDSFCPVNLDELIESMDKNFGRLYISENLDERELITVVPDVLRAKVEVGLVKDFASIDISQIQIDVTTDNFTINNSEDGSFSTNGLIEIVRGDVEVRSVLFDLNENLDGEVSSAVVAGQFQNISGSGVLMLPDFEFTVRVNPTGGDVSVDARVNLKGMLTTVIDFDGADELIPTVNQEVGSQIADDAITTPSPPESSNGGFFSSVGNFFSDVGATVGGFFGGIFN
eukprot:TRINITY_DN2489_c0_g1_i1.p1 TRINITY_DN2489_c0_g1~~TRINITY_DN2489_c0_g1_i1.p1  ORF type:complete len:291 (+),score=44.80 TRINITY_DN2489_c0_g1_i1:104-976(+)